ncbi:PadR family transcriptional regulator [Tessaracoccus oleiagri]|uniref:PadR family transcriptional regulator, regulatory protein PadR n=1 Tax=Tessaracoccus oleiagri TaxID=686624 RepID=A0A1G9JDY8_9ACTN|nr:PadR family transcriptional regulator [Tessaracoccus oleiagri]SDL35465.1 PadR family transcriptional regulator, regulatory protein PadR [Tessaracoccus oleiagri]
MAPNIWPADWQRGILDLCVMRLLSDGPTYGYELASRLTDAGLGEVKGGTLYPLLKRLESAEEVDIEWRPGESGPGRKFYKLNERGHARLRELSEAWERFSSTITRIVNAEQQRTPA